MKILNSLIICLTCTLTQSQTLDYYLQIAIENNLGIRAKETAFQAALQQVPQVSTMPDPTVSGSYLVNRMMLPMGNQFVNFSVMQMFPWFGTLDALESEAIQMADVKRREIDVAVKELIFRLKNTWWPMIEIDEKIRVLEEKRVILETDKELVSLKFEHGQAGLADVIKTDLMLDELNNEIFLLEHRREPLVVAFNKLLNREADAEIRVGTAIPNPLISSPRRLDSLVAENPLVAVFDEKIQAAQASQLAAATMRKPMIGAGIQYSPLSRRDMGPELPPNTGRDMYMPMVSVSVPIWRRKYDAAEEEKRLEQVMYNEMKEDLKNELTMQYEMAWHMMEEVLLMIEFLDSQIQKTQEVIDLLMASYSNAGGDFEEILRLQEKLFNFDLEKVTAKLKFQLALVRMDYLTGR